MRRQLRMSWQRLCRLIMISRPFGKPLRDKAIAVAGRVTIMEEQMTLKASCPVCLQVLSAPLDSDLRMTLAVHMSLWHADDVQLHWEVMQNKGRSIVHMPSFCFGAGMAAGIGALVVILARSHAQAFGNKRNNIIRLNPSSIAGLCLERQALSYQLLRSLPILSPISQHR